MDRLLCDSVRHLGFVWVLGHCSLVGNEWMDEAVGAAAALDQSDVVCMFASIRSLCRRREVVEFEHDLCRRVYGERM